MKFNGTDWAAVGTAGFSPGSVAYIDLAIDGTGSLYVAFTDYSDSPYYEAWVMKFNGTEWVAVGTDAVFLARYTTIAFDSSNTPYIAYELALEKASARRFDGTSWVFAGNSSFTAHPAEQVRLAIDSQDTPYVVFKDWFESTYSWKATVMVLK